MNPGNFFLNYKEIEYVYRGTICGPYLNQESNLTSVMEQTTIMWLLLMHQNELCRTNCAVFLLKNI